MCSTFQVAPRIRYASIQGKDSDSESDLDDSCDDPDFNPLENESSDISSDDSDSHPSNDSDTDLPDCENFPSSVANQVAPELAQVQSQVVPNINAVTEVETNPRGKPILKCKKCDKKFINLKSCIKHESKCGQTVFECNTCETKFKNLKYCKIHFKTLHKQPMFSCDNPGCETKFHTKAKLNSHMKKHQTCKCKTCHKSFKNQKVLKSHKFKKHNIKKSQTKKEWKCTLCPKTLKTDRGLRYHTQLHNMIIEDQTLEGVVAKIDVAPMEGIDGDQGAVLIMVEHNEDLVQEAMEEIIEVDGSSYN